MDHGGEGVSVYAEAKSEYTKQLCQYLVPALHKYFLDMLEDAKEKEPESKKLLLKFQVLLEEITDWNKDKVLRETGGISASTQCDYLEELLAAVFIAHTKVLSAIRLTTKQKKLQITIPKLDHFLHRTLTECARILWSNTYLFSPGAPSLERQRNLRQIETLLYDGVLQSIRGMLPVKNILREYLHEEEGGSDDEEEEAEGEEAAAASAAAEESTEARAPAAVEDLSGAALGADAVPSPAEDLSGAGVTDSHAPTLVVDTTQPVVPPFSGSDTNALPPAVETEPVLEEDATAAATAEEEILLMEGPALPFDDFEDLEKKAAAPATVQPESDELEMDFETLE
jgi:hypothetical protein